MGLREWAGGVTGAKIIDAAGKETDDYVWMGLSLFPRRIEA